MKVAKKGELKDFYGLLGLPKNATDPEIKRAFRALSQQLHPDVNKAPDAKEKFEAVHEAYKTLIDKEVRKLYDEAIKKQEGERTGKFMGTFQDFYDRMYATGISRIGPIPGDHIKKEETFRYFDIVTGAKKHISYSYKSCCGECEGKGFNRIDEKDCETCDGDGTIPQVFDTHFGKVSSFKRCEHCNGYGGEAKECEKCSGSGCIDRYRTVTITMPRRFVDGEPIRVPHRGHDGRNGGEAGDLLLTMKHDVDDPVRVTSDFDLIWTHPLPLETACMGGELEIALPDGKTHVIPVSAGTTSGTRVSIPEYGLHPSKKAFSGCLYIELQIELPRQLEALEKLKMALKE